MKIVDRAVDNLLARLGLERRKPFTITLPSHPDPARLGMIGPPYPYVSCCASQCGKPFVPGVCDAYLYRNVEHHYFVLFCFDCARCAELYVPERYMVVAV